MSASPEEEYTIFSVAENKNVTRIDPATESYVRSTARQQLSGHLVYTHRLKGEAYQKAIKQALNEVKK